ncbi:MAG: hypothetical protein IPL25_16015, partial [Saprospiraceae bacterium]|nr:hypothetical protein [Candidatus Vicinibacter affinis]
MRSPALIWTAIILPVFIPADFDIPFALCAPNDSATLCDDDLYLHTSFPLDSIS